MADQTLELVSQCLTGRASGLEELYLKFAGHAGAYLTRAGFAPEDVWNLTQETFTEAFKSLHTFDSQRGSFRVWLSMIARNVARRNRVRGGNGEHFDPELSECVFAAPPDSGENPHADEQMRIVRDCVAELPPEIGRIIRLRYVEGRTIPGIAVAINIPEAAVQRQLGQVRHSLTEHLQTDNIPGCVWGGVAAKIE